MPTTNIDSLGDFSNWAIGAVILKLLIESLSLLAARGCSAKRGQGHFKCPKTGIFSETPDVIGSGITRANSLRYKGLG